jgi:hypothetical protein
MFSAEHDRERKSDRLQIYLAMLAANGPGVLDGAPKPPGRPMTPPRQSEFLRLSQDLPVVVEIEELRDRTQQVEVEVFLRAREVEEANKRLEGALT